MRDVCIKKHWIDSCDCKTSSKARRQQRAFVGAGTHDTPESLLDEPLEQDELNSYNVRALPALAHK